MVENLAKIFNDNMANRQPKTSLVEVSANWNCPGWPDKFFWKNLPNCGPNDFLSKLIHNNYHWKKWATSEIFLKLPKVNNSPIGEYIGRHHPKTGLRHPNHIGRIFAI
jgi:hypothetical protein